MVARPPAAGFRLLTIRSAGITGKRIGARLSGLALIPVSLWQSLRLLRRHRPALAIGVGGYASGPVMAAAAALRVPTLIHEQNYVPGLTNRWLAPLMSRVAATFEETIARLGGRGVVTDGPGANERQRDFLLAELKAKLPALERVTVDYDWHGWICLTRDFLPHVSGAEDDDSVHYALGYQGSGVSFSLYAGKLLAWRAAGRKTEDAIPPVAAPLRRFPLHRFLRLAQVPVYGYFRMHDRMDRV